MRAIFPCFLLALVPMVACGAAAEDFDPSELAIDTADIGDDEPLMSEGELAKSSDAEEPSLGTLEQAQRATPAAAGGAVVIDIDPDRDCVGHYECTTTCWPLFGCFKSCKWVCNTI